VINITHRYPADFRMKNAATFGWKFFQLQRQIRTGAIFETNNCGIRGHSDRYHAERD
jgi:hypothetical protein